MNDTYYCTDEDGLNGIELKQGRSIYFTCLNPDRKIKFPFAVVAADNPLKDNRKRLLVSDLKSHYVTEIDEDGLRSIVGEYDNPGFDDGLTQSRLIHSPVGIACRGSSVYNAGHFTDPQGRMRLFQYLAGLKEFQSI